MSSAKRYLRLLQMIAPVLNTIFIHAVLEAINYLVFKIVNKQCLLMELYCRYRKL